MTDVVKRLHLNTWIILLQRRLLPGSVICARASPINVSIDTPDNNESSALTVKILADSTVELSDFIRNGEELPGKLVKGQLTDTIMTTCWKSNSMPHALLYFSIFSTYICFLFSSL